MSVRVNLLPEATKQRDKASQQRAMAGLAGVMLLATLGGTYLWVTSQVTDAEERLAVEQAHSAELRGEQAELIGFQELADRRESADALLIAAMGGEVSAAGILQDMAAVMPPDAQLDGLTVTIGPSSDPAIQSVGSFNLSGKTLTSHAPGVERMLISLDKVVGFRELYLNSSSLDDVDGDDSEDRIATFSLDGQVSPEAATGRYVEGLPEELR